MSRDTSYTLVDGEETMAVEVATARRRFTREEYHRMGEVGILKPTDRVELILADRAIVSVQNPVVLTDDSEAIAT